MSLGASQQPSSFGAPASAGASQPSEAFAFGGAAAPSYCPFGALGTGASQPPPGGVFSLSQPPAFGAPSTAAALFGGSSVGVPGRPLFCAGSLAAHFSVGAEAGAPAGRAIRKFKRPSARGRAR